jgi:hypothetical protein
MFGHAQAAVPMMPQAAMAQPQYLPCYAAYSGFGCHICSATCPDTSWCWNSCGYSYGCTDSRIYVAQVPVQDPVETLEQLKTNLKVALAGVEAQVEALKASKPKEGEKK